MSNIFITYGDDNFYKSRKRICKEAKKTGIFQKVIEYRPQDLPNYVKASPLFGFPRGGGYWVWKPFLIYMTLSKCKEDDVVWYVDAGCSINSESEEWIVLLNKIRLFNAIFFQYRDDVSYKGWAQFCSLPNNNNPQMIHWTKPSVVDYFKKYYDSDDFLHFNQVPSGFFIVKKTKNHLKVISEWYHLALFKPNLFIDPFGPELLHLPKTFNEHRHDQTILTLLIWKYQKIDKILVLPETLESCGTYSPCVVATRIHSSYIYLIQWQVCNHFP